MLLLYIYMYELINDDVNAIIKLIEKKDQKDLKDMI